MKYYPEVMLRSQETMLRRLGEIVTDCGFYLARGTALALQLGHLRSVDLDWFSPSPIEPLALAADLGGAGIPVDITDTGEGTLHGTADGVKLSFLEYRYPHLTLPIEWLECGVQLATLEDLACMRLSAIGGRGSKKDFIDIFALGRESFTLDQMLEFYSQKFSVSDLGHTLFALTYFDDAEPEETPEMLWQIEWDKVKRAIEGWVQEYTQRKAPPHTGNPGIGP